MMRDERRSYGPGGRGWLPTRGSHGSGRAQLSTRLLGHWSRCSTVHTVHDAHRREGIGFEKARESFP